MRISFPPVILREWNDRRIGSFLGTTLRGACPERREWAQDDIDR